jgi:serine/threonine-protein kinase
MIPTGIEDKYEVIQILRETAATAVLLVNYKKIGALRILKAIHRAHPDASSILSEAHLLQGIKSSQIPTIISVEDSNEMYYLVEEYVEGPTLREYLLETKLSKEELVKLAISLCTVMEEIHNAKPEPVLYRDMKPEHVILQNGQVRLIDFGISVTLSEAANAKPLGTKNWAAPEQLTGDNLTLKADVYSVGKILEFMQSNSYAKDDIKLKKLISKATAVELNQRIESISKLKEELLLIQNDKNNNKTRKGYLGKTVAVVGADHGVGTTHIAIKLCRYLNENKIEAFYKNQNDDTVHYLIENLFEPRIKEGVLYHKSFRGIINYGDAVEPQKPPEGLMIIDCGTDLELALEQDTILFITNASPWKKREYPSWIKEGNVYVITNFTGKLTAIKLAKEIKKRIFMYPYQSDVSRVSKEEGRVFKQCLKNEIVNKKSL